MAALKSGAVVYLDANILIYLTEGETVQKAALRPLMAGFEATAARIVTSDLSFTEVLVQPIRQQDQTLIEAYERLLTGLVEALPVSRQVLWLAAQLRATNPAQRTPDAIHVATATLTGAAVFVTGDRGIKNLPSGMALQTV